MSVFLPPQSTELNVWYFCVSFWFHKGGWNILNPLMFYVTAQDIWKSKVLKVQLQIVPMRGKAGGHQGQCFSTSGKVTTRRTWGDVEWYLQDLPPTSKTRNATEQAVVGGLAWLAEFQGIIEKDWETLKLSVPILSCCLVFVALHSDLPTQNNWK